MRITTYKIFDMQSTQNRGVDKKNNEMKNYGGRYIHYIHYILGTPYIGTYVCRTKIKDMIGKARHFALACGTYEALLTGVSRHTYVLMA